MNFLVVALTIFAAAFIIIQLHLLAMAIVGALFGAKIENYGIFMGSPLFRFNVGSIPVSVNYLPFGGFVKFQDGFDQIAVWKRILTALAGNAVLLATAMICLGFETGLGKFASGFRQIPLGAIFPFSIGKELVATLFNIANQNHFVALLGTMAAKMAAFNLLPLGSLNGGYILLNLIKAVFAVPDLIAERYQLTSLLVFMLVIFSYLAAAASYFLS